MDSNRYKTDKEYRKRMIQLIMKYNKTPKGRKNRKKWITKNPLYYSNYMKKRRQQLKYDGICVNCEKEKAKDNYTLCQNCCDKQNKKHKEKKLKNKDITTFK